MVRRPDAKLVGARKVSFKGPDYLDLLAKSWEMLVSVVTPVPDWLK